MYFLRGSQSGNRLYRTDGTPFGTTIIDSCLPPPAETPFGISLGNGKTAGGGAGVNQALVFPTMGNSGLWSTVGLGGAPSPPCANKLMSGTFFEVEAMGGLYFALSGGGVGGTISGLWKTDGTSTPVLIAPFSGGMSGMTSHGDKLYFVADDGFGLTSRLWVSDGNTVAPVPGSPVGSDLDVNQWAIVGNTAFIPNGSSPWMHRLDLSSGQMLSAVTGDSLNYACAGIKGPVVAGGLLFSMAWKSPKYVITVYNPAKEKLELVPAADYGISYSAGDWLEAAGNKVYFQGSNSATGQELWAIEVPSAEEVVRLGSPANPAALEPGLTSGPVLGKTWDPYVDHSSFLPTATVDVLGLSAAQVNVPLPPHGTLLCDPAALVVDLQVVAAGTPFALPIPNDTSLLGLTLCAQAGSIHALGMQLTNALDITLGVE